MTIKHFKRQPSLMRLFILLIALLALYPQAHLLAGEKLQVVTTIPLETSLGYEGTPKAADAWLEMIDSAEKNLDMAFFYLSTKKNELLEPVIAAVIKAAQRGVKVRFLVSTPANKSMEENNRQVIQRFEKEPNISVTTFNWKDLTGGILHAKYFIVDRSEAYVGSQNFDWRSLKHIHETGLRIRSPVIASRLSRIFQADWQFNRGDRESYKKMRSEKSLVGGKEHFIVSSPAAYNPPGVKNALDVLVQLIDSAGKKVTVQLLNYHVDIYRSREKFTVIDDALRRAAERGVKVYLLVSDWNKRKSAVDGIKDLVKVPNIQVRFATIPPYSKGFIPYARVIHSKVMRVDEQVSWVGTSNWSKGYFTASRNIEVVTHDPAVARVLDRLFSALWNSTYTYPVDPGKEYEAPKRQ